MGAPWRRLISALILIWTRPCVSLCTAFVSPCFGTLPCSLFSVADLRLYSSITPKDSTTWTTPSPTNPDTNSTIQWDVYICESKQCKERGSVATFGAFVGLAPPDVVAIHPATILKPKGKGPNIRCAQRRKNGKAFEVNNVDSVEKVHRILTKYMNVKVSDTSLYW